MPKTQNDFADDRDLWPIGQPDRLIRQFGCYATLLLIPLSWAGVGAVMLWQEWPFVLWPFAAVPLTAWVILLGAPLFVKMRAGALKMADAVVMTAEAWAARAGWVIDINADGYIGHMRPEIKPPSVEEIRPIIYTGPRLLERHTAGRMIAGPVVYPDQAERAIGDLPVTEQPEPPVKVRVWHLPNKERIEQAQLEAFVDGIFTKGWNRDTWLGQGISREQYDGLIMLLEEAQLLIDRKKGYAGKLSVRNARQARAVLDLPDNSG